MALTGYPVEDLALRGSFVDASRQAMQGLAEQLAAEGLGELVVVVGFLDGAPDAVPVLGTPKGAPQNAAAIVHRGRVAGRYAKHHLPNYGVFDEFRYFVPGSSLTVARVHGVDVAVAICEDIWQEGGPVAVTREAGAGLLLVINGSPYERNKDDTRLDLVRRRAAGAGCALAYVNMVGGQDELVFDGDSLVVAADGELLARARQFDTELLMVDLDLPAAVAPPTDEPSHVQAPDGSATTIERIVLSPDTLPAWEPATATVAERVTDEAEVYTALVTALRDYVAQERVPQRAARPVRRHRLVAGRRHRLRRGGCGERLRRLQPERVLERRLAHRRRRTWPGAPASTSRPCRSPPWSPPTRATCASTGSPRRTCRRGSGR